MRRCSVVLLLLGLAAGCGKQNVATAPAPVGPRRAEAFVTFGDERATSRPDDVAAFPGGDFVIAGCEQGDLKLVVSDDRPRRGHPWSTWIARIDGATNRIVWIRRSLSPCSNLGDDSDAHVAVGADGTIWVAAQGWGTDVDPGDSVEGIPVRLLALDGSGKVSITRELPEGMRVRAMTASSTGELAVAGNLRSFDGPPAFVAVFAHDGTQRWRTNLGTFTDHTYVDSITTDGVSVLVGGRRDEPSDADVTTQVGLVDVVRLVDGAVTSRWARRYEGVHVDRTLVAHGRGENFVAVAISRVHESWPASLPTLHDASHVAPTAFVVEPLSLTASPRWVAVEADPKFVQLGALVVGDERIAVAAFTSSLRLEATDRGADRLRATGRLVEIARANGQLSRTWHVDADSGPGPDHAKLSIAGAFRDGRGYAVVGEVRGPVETQGKVIATLPNERTYVWRPAE